MNFTFENQGTHTYLVYTVAENDALDSMSLGMLTNNKISGLAHTLFTQMDATRYIKYDVSAKISVKQFFTGQVNKKRLIGVFSGIVDAMLSAEDYMIDVNSIVLDLDYIFADVSTCETVLVCMPIFSDDFSVTDLGAFFKNIMFTTQFDQTENCDHVAEIINFLNGSPVFSLVEFKNLLDRLSGNAAPAPAAAPAPQPMQMGMQPQVQQPVPQPAPAPAPQPQVQQPVPQAAPAPAPQPQVQQPVPQAAPAPQPKPAAPAANQGFAIPGQSAPAAAPAPAAMPGAQPEVPEKKMSMFGLMMHYSKENAELYKQQKAAKKEAQAQAQPMPPQGQPAAPAPAANQGFAIPGQQAPAANQGFAIPGQSAPAPTPAPAAAPAPKAQPQVQQPVPQAAPAPAPQPQAAPAFNPQPMPQGQAMNFGETTVLSAGGGIGETTVLGAAPAAQTAPHLMRIKNNERIPLNKPVFRIGKEKSYVDYFIGDNSAISRSHANIISRDGEYFVVDTNSTNHTFVDGQMIQSNVETKITHGVRIKLANEDFEFRLF